jgi:excisionase family DNA binding protein
MTDRLSVSDVARLWGKSTKHVYRLIQSGKLVAVDVGLGARKRYVVPRDAIEKFEQSRLTQASTTKLNSAVTTSRWLS